ncbi:hypothetical protein AOLI_G00212140 [Acnodon oligacanthus]
MTMFYMPASSKAFNTKANSVRLILNTRAETAGSREQTGRIAIKSDSEPLRLRKRAARTPGPARDQTALRARIISTGAGEAERPPLRARPSGKRRLHLQAGGGAEISFDVSGGGEGAATACKLQRENIENRQRTGKPREERTCTH